MKIIGTTKEVDYLIENMTIAKLCLKCKAYDVCRKQSDYIKGKLNKSCGELIREKLDITIIEEE